MYFDIITTSKQNNEREKIMYQPAISKDSEGLFYALVVRKDEDGERFVCRSYAGRYFKTEKAAIRSTEKHIAKMNEC